LKAKWPTAQRRQGHYQDVMNHNHDMPIGLFVQRCQGLIITSFISPERRPQGQSLNTETLQGRPRRELSIDGHDNINVYNGFPSNCVEFWPTAISPPDMILFRVPHNTLPPLLGAYHHG
jgi:hypothetical protein